MTTDPHHIDFEFCDSLALDPRNCDADGNPICEMKEDKQSILCPECLGLGIVALPNYDGGIEPCPECAPVL